MCGILALFGKTNLEETKKALQLIEHRGKDASKIVVHKNNYFGFNRLAINDLSNKGVQPFENEKFVVLVNGEIYNTEQLINKYDLKLHSNSDIEIILALFEKIGISIIDELDGFYSGIILNKETNQLFTIRDYIGKKPLFWGETNSYHFITSELKSISKIKSFQIVPKGVCQIENEQIILLKEHQIPFKSKSELKTLLIEAVKKRIPKSNQKFGIFLSGGLDSSIIASIASKSRKDILYFALGDKNSSDVSSVRVLAKHLNIENKIQYVPLPPKKDLDGLIRKIVFHTESYNPSIISNGLATYLLANAAHTENLKVILSGEGADELFCGYIVAKNPETRLIKRKELIKNLHFTELRRLDMPSMANTIEVRCPFLDRNVFSASLNCLTEDLIEPSTNQGKRILRELFKNDLPSFISERKKVSFDVGSGVRKLVVEHLTKENQKERAVLKKIWKSFYPENLINHFYFHAYPTFDKAIDKRGITHK